MRIVTIGGLVLDVSGVDGDTTLLLFRGVVNLIEGLDLAQTLGSEHLGDRSGQSGLAMVNVADRANVDMRFIPLENFFCHNITFKSLFTKLNRLFNRLLSR
jgi:hypothetical protein